MTDNPGHAVETMRSKLRSSKYDIAEDDRELLLDVSDTIRVLGQSKFSDHRHEFILRRGLKIAKSAGGLAAAINNKEAAESIVGWINATYDNAETNKDYRVAFRAIGKLATDGDEMPNSVEWVPGGYPSNYDPAPNPSEMIRWEDDIRPMLEACHNARDKALVALAWDLGPRPGELFDLEVGAINDHKYGLQVTLDGKRGRRSPILVPSVSYVNSWVNVHPGSGSDTLFCGLHSEEPISNNRIRDILKEVANRAEVDKPVTPTNFRKSSASHLASQGVSQAHLEDHHGWTRGSEIAARYVSVFDDANNAEIAAAHGIEIETDDGGSVDVTECPRCEQRAPTDEDLCPRCGQALNPEAAASVDSTEGDIAQSLAQLPPEKAERVLEVADLFDDPDIQRLFLD